MHASTETFTIAVLYLFFYNIQQVLGKGICALASIMHYLVTLPQ